MCCRLRRDLWLWALRLRIGIESFNSRVSLGSCVHRGVDYTFPMSAHEETGMETFGLFSGRSSQFFLVSLMLLVFLAPQTVFAAESCAANSAIDQVPYFIGQSFLDILNRVPGGEGQTFWISRLEGLNTSSCRSANPTFSGGTCEWNSAAQVVLELLNSPESISRNGNLSSNNAFVTALYQLFLRRAPDAGGLQSNLSALASRATRASIVAGFLSSAEYRHRFVCTANGNSNPSCRGAESVDPVSAFVAQTGKDILGSLPDAASQASWTNDITSKQAGMCKNPSATAFSVCDRVIEAQMIMDVFNGSAYQKSHPSIADNKAFVTALYQHLLQRAPDAAGLQSYTNYLSQTNDRVGAVYAFITSDEYRQRFACYAGSRDRVNLGFTGHPLTQPAYSDSGISFDEQTALVKDAGGLWYRFDVVAPSTGADFTKMDLLLGRAQAHGVQLLPILLPMVDRGHDDLTTIYRKSRDMAFNFVSRYKASIHVWELSNEQDVYTFHKVGDAGWVPGASGGEQITDYDPQRYAIAAAVLRGLADGVRAADSDALRVINFGGWLHIGFLQRIENDGIPYDILALHWYQGMGEMTCVGEGAPCPATLKHFNVVQRMQAITHGKPLWITETNYSPVTSKSVEANTATEATYLPSALQKYVNSPRVYPFQTIIIYELLDEPNLPGQEAQAGVYSVTPAGQGRYALGAAKVESRSLRNVFGQ